MKKLIAILIASTIMIVVGCQQQGVEEENKEQKSEYGQPVSPKHNEHSYGRYQMKLRRKGVTNYETPQAKPNRIRLQRSAAQQSNMNELESTDNS